MAAEKKSSAKVLRIRQIRSGIGFPVGMRETLKGLGLRRLHQEVERADTPEIRGMISKVSHLVEVVE
ncbi:MAG: 50S ribosomal protein L30 [Thermoanaerobaculia bacterium]